MKKFTKITLITSASCFLAGMAVLLLAAFLGATSLIVQLVSGGIGLARSFAGSNLPHHIEAEIRDEILDEGSGGVFGEITEEIIDEFDENNALAGSFGANNAPSAGGAQNPESNGGTGTLNPGSGDTGTQISENSGNAPAQASGNGQSGAQVSGGSSAQPSGSSGSGTVQGHHTEQHHDESYCDEHRWDAYGTGSQVYTYTGIDTLKISASMCAVQVVEGETGGVVEAAVYSDQVRMIPEMEKEKNRQELELEFSGTHQNGVSLSQDQYKAIVMIPAGYTFDQVELDTEMGVVTADKISARKLDVSSEMGDITVKSAEADLTELDCEMGNVTVTLTGEETDYNYQIDRELTGQLSIGTADYSGKNSQRSIVNPGAKKQVEADCEMGTIAILFESP